MTLGVNTEFDIVRQQIYQTDFKITNKKPSVRVEVKIKVFVSSIVFKYLDSVFSQFIVKSKHWE